MQRNKENRRIFIEDVVRAIAVMNIPIDDRNSPQPVMPLKIPSGDRDIGKQAKPHRAIGESMMSGWPNRAERVISFTRHHRIRSAQNSAHAGYRRIVAHERDNRIARVDYLRPIFARVTDEIDVLGLVDTLNPRSHISCRDGTHHDLRHALFNAFGAESLGASDALDVLPSIVLDRMFVPVVCSLRHRPDQSWSENGVKFVFVS